MNCEYCGSTLKELFTSTYCPDCDSDENLEGEVEGEKLSVVDSIVPFVVHYPATTKEFIPYIDSIVARCIEMGYKVVSSSNGLNTEHDLTSPSGFKTRFKIEEKINMVRWEQG